MSPPTRGAPSGKAGGAKSKQPPGELDHHSVAQGALLDAEGRVRADVGADLARHAVHTSWRLAADGAIADLAASGRRFTAEDVRERVGVMTGRESALSAAFRVAARRGEIVLVGFVEATRPEAHGRALRVWVGAS